MFSYCKFISQFYGAQKGGCMSAVALQLKSENLDGTEYKRLTFIAKSYSISSSWQSGHIGKFDYGCNSLICS